MEPGPKLTSESLLLRRYRQDDADGIYQAVCESVSELAPWFAWCHESYTRGEAEQFVKDQSRWWDLGEVYNFAITDRKTAVYCGGCLLNNINLGDRLANMAYWVRTSWTRQGIASASARLVARYGFEHLGLHRVEIVAARENLASIRVAEKAGAIQEGELRRRITVRGEVYDAVLFSLLPDDL